ncbi:hypothetical protein PISMIDRAFT_690936 [Pisolithus microcarpus 441]|uniref:Uncharacterized protein n=1 Tax=Pisolithus microcarpus 441 TaxID=765257 RepID=A0A0C9Y0A1_9AGAM|nr:hypothetical protein PISMIDRAFT_690936 [Pisolithus microcarpus 441]
MHRSAGQRYTVIRARSIRLGFSFIHVTAAHEMTMMNMCISIRVIRHVKVIFLAITST